jgi:hypothetical protein
MFTHLHSESGGNVFKTITVTHKYSVSFLREDTCYNSKEKFINAVTGHIPRVLFESYESRILCDVRAEIIYL